MLYLTHLCRQIPSQCVTARFFSPVEASHLYQHYRICTIHYNPQLECSLLKEQTFFYTTFGSQSLLMDTVIPGNKYPAMMDGDASDTVGSDDLVEVWHQEATKCPALNDTHPRVSEVMI